MSKYQEALETIINQIDILFEDDIVFNYRNSNEYILLKELVDKEVEFQSRKEKLIVGSKWICLVKHAVLRFEYTTLNHPGDVVKIINIKDDMITYQYKRSIICIDYPEHFILCYKPEEEGV